MRFTFAFILLFFVLKLSAQNQVFTEDFETTPKVTSSSSGLGSWSLNSTLYSQGAKSYSSVVTSGDTTYLTTDAFSTSNNYLIQLQFDHICKVAFTDGGYIEVSGDNGSSWHQLTGDHYKGSVGHFGQQNKFNVGSYGADWAITNAAAVPQNTWWKPETFDLSALVPNAANVKIRFVLHDGGIAGAEGNAGWFIDNIKVTATYSELDPPTISISQYSAAGNIYHKDAMEVFANINDVSGIDTAILVYTVSSGETDTIGLTSAGNNLYSAPIPFYGYGKTITYYIVAVDKSPVANSTISTPTYIYNKHNSISEIEHGTCSASTFTIGPIVIKQATSAEKFSQHISIFSPAELGTGGLIKKLAWNKSNNTGYTGNDGTFNIYLKNTASVFVPTNANTFTKEVTEATLVYSSSTQNINTQLGWQEFILDSIFNYNGIENLMILVEWERVGSATDNYAKFCYDIAEGMSATWSGESYPPISVSGAGKRPNIKIGFHIDTLDVDASITQISSPSEPQSVNTKFPLNIDLKNWGKETLTNAIISWTIDGGSPKTKNWTGSLMQNSSIQSFFLDSLELGGGAHTIEVCISKPNGKTDLNPENNCKSFDFFVCETAMSGIYTIDANASGSRNFKSFSEATLGLQCGISGAVTFNVAAGTYKEQFELAAISGLSPTDTICFQSAQKDSSGVIVEHDAIDYNDNYVIKLNDISNVTFKGITFKALDKMYARVFVLDGAINDLSIQNCVIATKEKTSIDHNNMELIHSQSTVGNNFNLENCVLRNGSQILTFEGDISGSSGWMIKNNIVEGHFGQAFSFKNAKSIAIENNRITARPDASATNYIAILLNNASGTAIINNNKISAQSTQSATGIHISNSVFSWSNPSVIKNNFISLSHSTWGTAGAGIMINAKNINLYHNSINMTGNRKACAALSLPETKAFSENITIINNHFVNQANGYSVIIEKVDPAQITNHHNNLYSNNPLKLAKWGKHSFSTSEEWRVYSGEATGSLNIFPHFVSNEDLHVTNNLLDKTGIALNEITDDIDGETRNSSTPDIGADEFTISAEDLMIVELVNPIPGCGLGNSEQITLRIRNIGSQNISNNLTAKYFFEGGDTISENILTTINSGNTLDFSFAGTEDMDVTAHGADSVFVLKAWLELSSDDRKFNDTINIPIISKPTPKAPIVTSDTVEYGNSASLSAQGSAIHFWSSETAVEHLAKGNSYTTPLLYDTTTYWVSDRIPLGARTAQCGTGTTRFPYAPTTGMYKYSWSRMIYKANELGSETGNIESIAFYVNNSSANCILKNQKIYMDLASYIVLPNTDYVNAEANMKKVFDGSITINGSGWITIQLSESFAYDGTSSLVIQWENHNGQWVTNGGSPFFNISSVPNTIMYQTSDISFLNTQVSGNINAPRPNMRANFRSYGCHSHRVPATVIVDSIPAIDIGITSILSPQSGIDLTNTEEVRVIVKNFATNPTDIIPLAYKINGVTVRDTLTHNLQYGDSIAFTFKQKADFSDYTNYAFETFTELSTDVNLINDSANTQITNRRLSYCGSAAFTPNHEDISRVSIATLDNASSPIGQTYSDFTSSIVPTKLVIGNPYKISISSDFSRGFTHYNDCWVNVFIDYNHDGKLDTLRERVFSSSIKNSETITGIINIPDTNVVTGIYSLMRVVLAEGENIHTTGPCNQFSWGEVEDYYIELSKPGTTDIGIVGLSPVGPANTRQPIDFYADIKNFGADTIKKAAIVWQLDNTIPDTSFWTGILESDSIAKNVNIGSIIFNSGAHSLKVWTESPNDGLDGQPFNDTLTIDLYGCDSALNGTYTLGNSTSDFPSFDAAINTLQNCGVSGHVVFNIESGEYTTQLLLETYSGVSDTSTITFQAKNGGDVSIVARKALDKYAIRFSNASHIHLNDLTIKAVQYDFDRVISFQGKNSYNEIRNCVLEGSMNNNELNWVIEARGNNSHNKFINNEIRYAFNLVYWGSPTQGYGNIFRENNIHNYRSVGCDFVNQDSLIFEDNKIENNDITNVIGIPNVYGCRFTNLKKASLINRNKVKLASIRFPVYGLRFRTSKADNSSKVLVSNNMISCKSELRQYGLLLEGSKYINAFHNSINLYGLAKVSYSLFMENCDSIQILNSIFVNQFDGYVLNINTSSSLIDHNNYYTSTGYIAKWNGNNISTIGDLKNKSGMNQNSISTDPLFIDNTDLHTINPLLAKVSKALKEVAFDFDLDKRSSTNPTIGADEITLSPFDVGISGLTVSSNNECYTANEVIAVNLFNYGFKAADFSKDAVSVHLRISGTNATTYTPITINTGILSPGKDTAIVFSLSYDMSVTGTYTFNAHSVSITDTTSSNDTMTTADLISYPTITNFPFTENFESFEIGDPGKLANAWRRNDNPFKWKPILGATPSPHTGPEEGHNGYGKYIYADAQSLGGEALLETPCLDFNNIQNPRLNFWYSMIGGQMGELHIEIFDTNNRWVSVRTIIGEQNPPAGSYWLPASVDLSKFAGQITRIRFRAIRGLTENSDIAIDDILIYDAKPFDIGVEKILEPTVNNAIVGSNMRTVKLRVYNYGTSSITSTSGAKVGFIYDALSPVEIDITETILPQRSADIEIKSSTAVLSGNRQIKYYTKLSGDNSHQNDTVYSNFLGQAVKQISYGNDFEHNIDFHTEDPISTWERGVPKGNTIKQAYSNSTVWMTKLDTNYQPGITAYLYTPYFDFSRVKQGDSATLSFYHWADIAPNDGGYIEYTMNGGSTWISLGYTGDANASNWYTSVINGQHVWERIDSSWQYSSYKLSQFAGSKSPIQFRFAFTTSSTLSNNDGWAIDDFRIELPRIPVDPSVIYIETPNGGTQIGSINNIVKVKVKNYGSETLLSTPIHYEIDGKGRVSETMNIAGGLAPDSIAEYSFATTYQGPLNGYQLCVFTSHPDDTYKHNDTTCADLQATTPDVDAAISVLSLSPNQNDTTRITYNTAVSIRIINNGLKPLDSVAVEYSIGPSLIGDEMYRGAIKPGDSADYTFSTTFHCPERTYYVCGRVKVTDDPISANNEICNPFVGIDDVSVNPTSENTFSVEQNQPNPAVGNVSIQYYIPQSGNIRFELRNALGQLIQSESFSTTAGQQSIRLDANQLTSGVYYYSIEYKDQRITHKMIVTE